MPARLRRAKVIALHRGVRAREQHLREEKRAAHVRAADVTSIGTAGVESPVPAGEDEHVRHPQYRGGAQQRARRFEAPRQRIEKPAQTESQRRGEHGERRIPGQLIPGPPTSIARNVGERDEHRDGSQY